MNIKKIINFEVKDNKDKTLQQKSIKALGYFLVLMILCTLLSRFADTLTIPIIRTDRSKQMTINHDISPQGSVIQKRDISISTLPNMKVNYVNVGVGSLVKTGDVLVELDLDTINKQIEELSKQISDKQKLVARAQEDYNIAASEIDKNIQELLNAVNDAEKRLNDFKKKSKEDKEASGLSEEELAADYNAKKDAYNEAVNNKSNSLLSAQRTLDDVTAESNTDELSAQLAQVQALASAEGKVLAQSDGVITKVSAEAGVLTSEEAILAMADKSAGYKFVAQIPKEQKKYAVQGQPVSVQLDDDNNGYLDELTIESVTKDKDDESLYNVTVNIPVGIGEVGESGKINISSDVKKYTTCVPLEALHSEGNNQYYILVVDNVETVLGEEMRAQKISVVVKEKNDTYAALEDGTISSNQDIIISSNKNISDGDRVRKDK